MGEIEQSSLDISVVMPVFNAGTCLRRSIESIFSQTKRDFELICVNDGSTDDSLEILREYAVKDSRLQILDNEHNEGAAYSRNRGVNVAQGEYVVFVDADDYYEIVYLEKLWNKCKKYSADIGFCLYAEILGQPERKRHSNKSQRIKSLGAKVLDSFCLADVPELVCIIDPNPWSKMCRRMFILENGIQFQDLPACNDVYFHYVALFKAKKLVFVDEELVSYYCSRDGAISSHRHHHPLCIYYAIRKTIKDLRKSFLWESLRYYYNSKFISNIDYELQQFNNIDKNRMIAFWQKRGFRNIGMDSGYDWVFSNGYAFECYTGIQTSQPSTDREYVPGNPRRIPQSVAPKGIGPKEILGEKDLKKNSEIKISVIVPVYNVEEYLKECLDSLCGQNFNGYEVICVDDGSTDGSYEILKEYESKENKIRVFCKENEGPSVARNYGIRRARGKYIVFVDSDDILCTGKALSIMWERVDENELDVLFYDTELIFSMELEERIKERKKRYFERKKEYGLYNRACDLFADFVMNNDYVVMATGACVRKKVFFDFHLEFPVGRLNEDKLYMFKLLLKAGKAMHIKENLYGYRQRLGSREHQNVTYGRVVDNIYMLLEMEDLYKSKKWPEYVDKAIRKRISIQRQQIEDYYKSVNVDKVPEKAQSAVKRHVIKSFIGNGWGNKKLTVHLLPQGRIKVFWGMNGTAWIGTCEAWMTCPISVGDFIVASDSACIGCFSYGMPVCNMEAFRHCVVKPLVLVQDKDYVDAVKRLTAYGFLPSVDILNISQLA